MPIVFQQPGPISEAASSGAGAATQFSRDLPVLERQQAQIAEMLARHYGAGGGGGGGAHLPQRPQQGALYTGGANGQNMQAPSYEPPQRDDPLVQAEVIRLQQLRNGMAYVDQQEQGGSLTPEEAGGLRTQLQTGINPLQQRQQRAQAKALEEQTQQTMHQNAQLTSLQNMDATQRAQAARNMMYENVDEDGNGYRVHFDPMTGRSTYHEVKAPTERTDRTQATQQQLARIFQTEMAAVDREYQGHVTAGTPPAQIDARLRTPEARRAHAVERARATAAFANIQSTGASAAAMPSQEQQAAAMNRLQQTFERGSQAGVPDPGRVNEAENPTPPGGGFNSGYDSLPELLANNSRPERPNELVTSIPVAEISRAAQHAASLYNRQSRVHQLMGPATRALGHMTDMLLNAHNRQRHLSRHELRAYQELQRTVANAEGNFGVGAFSEAERGPLYLRDAQGQLADTVPMRRR